MLKHFMDPEAELQTIDILFLFQQHDPVNFLFLNHSKYACALGVYLCNYSQAK